MKSWTIHPKVKIFKKTLILFFSILKTQNLWVREIFENLTSKSPSSNKFSDYSKSRTKVDRTSHRNNTFSLFSPPLRGLKFLSSHKSTQNSIIQKKVLHRVQLFFLFFFYFYREYLRKILEEWENRFFILQKLNRDFVH